MIAVDEFLLHLRSLGVKVWPEDGGGDAPQEVRLRYRAPKEIITPSLLKLLQENKTEILAFLQQANKDNGYISVIPPRRGDCWANGKRRLPGLPGLLRPIPPLVPPAAAAWPYRVPHASSLGVKR